MWFFLIVGCGFGCFAGFLGDDVGGVAGFLSGDFGGLGGFSVDYFGDFAGFGCGDFGDVAACLGDDFCGFAGLVWGDDFGGLGGFWGDDLCGFAGCLGGQVRHATSCQDSNPAYDSYTFSRSPTAPVLPRSGEPSAVPYMQRPSTGTSRAKAGRSKAEDPAQEQAEPRQAGMMRYEKSKSLGSGGSMVARLKLKGIDGRTPPGVEPAAQCVARPVLTGPALTTTRVFLVRCLRNSRMNTELLRILLGRISANDGVFLPHVRNSARNLPISAWPLCRGVLVF